MKELYLIGYSGHAFVIADAVSKEEFNLKGYYELKENLQNPFQIKYMGNESEIKGRNPNQYYFPAIGENSIRKNVIIDLESKRLNQVTIIHPNTSISPLSNIGKSTFISSGVTINPLVQIGIGCIINTNATIEHECIIGDYTHIAPGTVLAGNVSINSSSFIGANTVVIQGIKIGSNVVVGAGSVVIKDIPDNQIWVGNPARRIR